MARVQSADAVIDDAAAGALVTVDGHECRSAVCVDLNDEGGTVFVTGFPAGGWATNCFVLASAPGEDCLVVDPGQDSMEELSAILTEHKLRPVAVLLTHGHIDHVWSVAPLTAGHDIPAFIHPDDRYRLADPAGSSFAAARESLLAMTKGELELTEPQDVRPLIDGEALDIAGLSLMVRHAPGHTEGSVTFMSEREGPRPPVMLSGDLLFAGSIGRTDLPGGDPLAMQESLRRVVLPLDDDTVVMPGHGPHTTIGSERVSNPYLQELEPGESRETETQS
jgi:hydroxyacylglutathione hydrolase